MRCYPEYKESGVEWIGEIPKDWTISKVKHEFESLDNLRVPLNSETRGSMKLKVYDYYGASGVIDKVENYIFDEPLILIGEDGANLYLRSTPLAFKATGKYWVNNHAHVLRPKHGNIDYLVNMLESLDYTHYITGAAQPKLTSEHLTNITVIVPLLPEQTQIANFLDRKTQQIDELIRIKERRIELLHEQRTALINQAVTKGLDSTVEMKPSGVEWIGEIPKHWTISKVKHEFESLDNLRIPLNSETRGSMELKIYDYYGASGVIDKVENYIFDEPLILIGEDGANLYLRSTPLAFKAIGKYWVNNHAHVLGPKHGNIDYLTNMLESLDYTHYITGAAQPKLTSDNLMNITVITPPPLEQDRIANFLDRKAGQIDQLITAEQRKIELLKEYRQSLISEAVTGKIDVRNEV